MLHHEVTLHKGTLDGSNKVMLHYEVTLHEGTLDGSNKVMLHLKATLQSLALCHTLEDFFQRTLDWSIRP